MLELMQRVMRISIEVMIRNQVHRHKCVTEECVNQHKPLVCDCKMMKVEDTKRGFKPGERSGNYM